MSKIDERDSKSEVALYPSQNDSFNSSFSEEHTKLLLEYIQTKEKRSKLEKKLEELYSRIKSLYQVGALAPDPDVVDINVTESKARIAWKARLTEEVGEDRVKEIEKHNTETDIRIWVSRVVNGTKKDPIPPQYRRNVPFKVIQ